MKSKLRVASIIHLPSKIICCKDNKKEKNIKTSETMKKICRLLSQLISQVLTRINVHKSSRHEYPMMQNTNEMERGERENEEVRALTPHRSLWKMSLNRPSVLLENSVLSAHVQRPFLLQTELEATVGKPRRID